MNEASRAVLAIPSRSWAFVIGASFGVAFLLVIGATGLFVSAFGGHGVASEAECEAAAQAQAAQSRIVFARVGVLVGLATVAVAAGGRRLPALLLVVVVAALVLNHLAEADPASLPWVPRQLSLLSPGMVLLAVASSAQLVEQVVRTRIGRASA